MEESRSSVAVVPYPVSYAFTTVLELIEGYFSMILSLRLNLLTSPSEGAGIFNP